MASISVYDISSTSFSVMLTGLQTDGVTYTRKCQWNVRETSSNNFMGSAVTYISPGETEGGDCTFSGMSANTEYSISCTVYRTDTGAWLASFSEEVTTSDSSGGGETDENWVYGQIPIGTIEGVYDTSSYVRKYTVRVFQMKFENAGTAIFYSFNSGDTIGYLSNSLGINKTSGTPSGYILAQDDDNGNGSEFRFEYEVNTTDTYYLYVRYYDGSISGDIQICIEAPSGTSEDLPYVMGWSWTTQSGTVATGLLKTQARNAVLNQEATTDFSHIVWDDLVNKVDEIVKGCGYEWDSTYANYNYTKALPNSKGEYILTADMFNSLRNNIEIVGNYHIGVGKITDAPYTENDVVPEGEIPHPVESGQKVYGNYFITIANYINECIYTARDNGIFAE